MTGRTGERATGNFPLDPNDEEGLGPELSIQ